jgi:hypothetical protein
LTQLRACEKISPGFEFYKKRAGQDRRGALKRGDEYKTSPYAIGIDVLGFAL